MPKITNQVMLIRISLILAVLAALAVGVVNFVFVKDKITTLTHRPQHQRGKTGTRAGRTCTAPKRSWPRPRAMLTQTQQELADTQAARDKAVANAPAQTKRADHLSAKLATTTQERDDARKANWPLTRPRVLPPNKWLNLSHIAQGRAGLRSKSSSQENTVLQHASHDCELARLQLYEGRK